jgi:hypothetical protein
MKPVLLDIEPGQDSLASTVSWAAALRLLSRGAFGPVRLLAPTRRARRLLGTSLPVISERQAPQAIRESALVVLAGKLVDVKALERAARWVVMAKEAGVPVALAAVRLPDVASNHPALAVLAQCDSVSAGDAASARRLAALRRDRIECTAPLELLLECEPELQESRPFTVGLCARTLRRGGRPLQQILQHLSEVASAQILVFEAGESRRRRTAHGFHARPVTTWNEALLAVSRCHLFVAEPDSMWLHMAAAVGAAPVAWLKDKTRSELHDRLGLDDLVLSGNGTPGSVVEGLERGASRVQPFLRRRIDTLRMVAWRSLGILAQAVRSTPLDFDALDAGTRGFVAQVLGRTPFASARERSPYSATASLGLSPSHSVRSGHGAALELPNEQPPAERLESGRFSCVSKR